MAEVALEERVERPVEGTAKTRASQRHSLQKSVEIEKRMLQCSRQNLHDGSGKGMNGGNSCKDLAEAKAGIPPL